MAAYAALVSLLNIIDQIQNHPRLSTSLNKKQIESLGEKIGFLQEFIVGYSDGGHSEEAQVLESQIASAAYEAEDLIESHIVDQIHAASISLLDLQEVLEDTDSIKEKVMEFKGKMGFKDRQPAYSTPAISSRSLTIGKNTMVGFDDELIQVMEWLTGQQSNRQIIPIIGMGGIGKTTLTRNVYEHLAIVQHFDIRAWAVISQEYNVREILLELLFCQRRQESDQNYAAFINEMDQKTEDQLGEQLYKSLSGRRYMIVLDDMWSIDAWDRIKFFFPDYNNASRLVVTTRLREVADHFGSSYLAMNFLDEDKSWKLFCEKAFPQEGCPPELEEIGKKIARKCKGLPLSIVVIAGLLRKSSRTQEHWENFAEDINSILNSGEDDQCMSILSLSYSHLPAHLRPCFLYMGIFPEDHEIRVSGLIKLWVAEGFLKPNNAQSLEEIALCYLKDLIDRNLILVRRMGSNGKIKTCNIHDLLRALCLRVAEKERFLLGMKAIDIDITRGLDKERRIVFHDIITEEVTVDLVFHALPSTSRARSLICVLGQMPFKFKLLRVLNVVHRDSLEAAFRQVNLRYIACKGVWRGTDLLVELPSSISLLWNVQTLVVKGGIERFVAPSEIWVMTQIRHLDFDEICLSDPPNDGIVLRNLQTLKRVLNLRLTEEVCKRIPNVKRLGVMYHAMSEECETSSWLHNLGQLHKLESLSCIVYPAPKPGDLLQNLTLPSSLKKLSLSNCNLRWEDLTTIGSLPRLEALKLESESVRGPEWDPVEGQFLCLKFLKIHSSDLVYWNADNYHFPVLETLFLDELTELEEIPLGIGEIPTLEVIRVDFCSESTAISAMKIFEEQDSLGNDGLHVRVKFVYKADLEIFKEKVELESFTSSNFLLEAALDHQQVSP